MIRRLWGCVAVLALVAAAACSDEAAPETLDLDTTTEAPGTTDAPDTTGSEPTTTTTDSTTPDEGGDFTPEPMEWSDCGNAECDTLDVPLDWSDPGGETVQIMVARVPAEGERIGALFFNPGGPGAEAASSTSTYASLVSSSVREHFDIVGMDPRGVGDSVPIGCGLPALELYADDPTPDSAQDRDAMLATSEELADDCEARSIELLPHVGTRSVARDLDAVREAMGDEQLNYIGFSYGTVIGQVYADLFPERVRSMVLDGVVEIGPDGLEQAEIQGAGFELAVERFAANCASDPGCPAGPDPLALLDAVTAEAEAAEAEDDDGGIPAPGADRPAGPDEVSIGTAYAMYAEELWGPLEDAIADAANGDGSGFVQLADGYLGLVDFTMLYAVTCLDFDWPNDPDAAFDAAEASKGELGPIGESVIADGVRCIVWPTEPEPLEPVTAPGAPPILVISTTGDPATPYEAGVKVADRLESGVLLTYEGDGHTVALDGVPCVSDVLERYLVDLEPPDDGTTC